MTTLYTLQQLYYDILEKIIYTYCKDCGEITIDGECDYCCLV